MAEGKKAFVVYCSWKDFLEDLTNEQLGKWISWVMDYCNDKWEGKEIEYPDDQSVKMACKMTRQNLKRDLDKYNKKVEAIKKAREKNPNNNKQQLSNETEISTETNTEISTETKTDSIGDIGNRLKVIGNRLKDKEDNKLSNKDLKEHKSKPSVPKSEFEKTFDEFVSMRNKIKKPMTANAKERMLKKLDSICGNDEQLKIKVLIQSIDKCWQDIYPLKAEDSQQYGNNTPIDSSISEDIDLSFLDLELSGDDNLNAN